MRDGDNPATESRPGTMRGATQVLKDILYDLERGANDRPLTADETADGPQARLGDILDRLDERAFGFLLLLLALPCCLPFIYLLPQIVAVPMLALAGQLAMGRHHPWLPKNSMIDNFQFLRFTKCWIEAKNISVGLRTCLTAISSHHERRRRSSCRRIVADPHGIHSGSTALDKYHSRYWRSNYIAWPD